MGSLNLSGNYWCLVDELNPIFDITTHYKKFANGNRSLNTMPSDDINRYRNLGYFVIVSSAMKSSVSEALFATNL